MPLTMKQPTVVIESVIIEITSATRTHQTNGAIYLTSATRTHQTQSNPKSTQKSLLLKSACSCHSPQLPNPKKKITMKIDVLIALCLLSLTSSTTENVVHRGMSMVDSDGQMGGSTGNDGTSTSMGKLGEGRTGKMGGNMGMGKKNLHHSWK